MHNKTTKSFEIKGLKNIDQNKHYTFISTHSNIIMDSYDVALSLISNGYKGPYQVAGDNLMNLEFTNTLFKLLGTITAIRTNPTKKDILEFSKYIYKLNKEEKSLWIGQRAGRAKDNINKTNPSIIKSITLSQRLDKYSLNEIVNGFYVPVSISRYYEPCDRKMAKEITKKERNGVYTKKRFEDVISMFLGIIGWKEKIVVHFGKPLNGDFSDAEDVAKAIDEQIVQNYELHETNHYAYDLLTNQDMSNRFNPLEKKLRGLGESEKYNLLRYYAHPKMQKINRSTLD